MVTLPEMPPRVAALPRDARGYPVPWFVHWENGVPYFRIIGMGKMAEAVRFERCWVCGQPRGRNFSFVIGPMCAINRTSGEPPCHLDCATFAAKACPFLTHPKMRRNTKDIPGERFTSPTHHDRNPGAAGVWSTRSFKVIRGLAGEALFEMGPPSEVSWWSEGRPATREEIVESMKSGLVLLEGMALDSSRETDEFNDARLMLNRMFAAALELAPR